MIIAFIAFIIFGIALAFMGAYFQFKQFKAGKNYSHRYQKTAIYLWMEACLSIAIAFMFK